FFQAEDGIRDGHVTGVQTCALPICHGAAASGQGEAGPGGAEVETGRRLTVRGSLSAPSARTAAATPLPHRAPSPRAAESTDRAASPAPGTPRRRSRCRRSPPPAAPP